MNNPFFSIIIPTYNSAETLKRCLDSVLFQNYTNFEILLMDGVSSDQTLQIARSYKDNRIKISSKPDTGIYDAMNKSIDIALGQWLYFLGSDDKLYSSDVLDSVEKNIGTEKPRIIYANVFMNENILDNKCAKYDGKFDLNKLLIKNICHQSIFYNHNVFKQIGYYNTKYKSLADYDFNLRSFSKIKFTYVDLIIANYTTGGFSANYNDENFNNDFNYNIANYYKNSFFNPAFLKKRDLLWNAFETNKYGLNVYYRVLAFIAYIYQKLRYLASFNK